jgi:ssDNA-binding Zn-finger/Zn-ribbon topoisomerase 1
MDIQCENCKFEVTLKEGQDPDSFGDCPNCGEFAWKEWETVLGGY